MKHESRAGVVGLLFVLSGALGLIYQVAWFKYLALFLGNTTYAQTIVLATFMGGLAIGAAMWGRRADRTRNPLALYGWLEVGISLYCLLYPWIQGLLRELFVSTVRSAGWESDSGTVLAFKLIVSLISLLPPTVLMGGTLPVLVRFLTRSLNEAGSTVATLYFLNSFGAVVGTVLAGFFFIRLVGLQTTVLSAAVVNGEIGCAALLLSRWSKFSFVPVSTDTTASTESETIYDHQATLVAMAVAGISGFCAMAYEVSWVRMLIPILGSSTYSFSLMLVAFISGIAIGSAIVTRFISRSRDLMLWLAGTQAGVAVSMLLVLPFYGAVPYIFWSGSHLLARSDSSYPLFLVFQLVIGFLLLVIPTIFMGMGLPVATRIAANSVARVGGTVGSVFSVNTIGTVAGTILAGLVMFPAFGVQKTVEIVIAINGLTAVVILLITASGRTSYRRRAAIVAVVIMAGIFVQPNWDQSTMLSGVFRFINKNVTPPESYGAFVRQQQAMNVLSYEEGTTATVGVIETGTPEGPQNVLIINGKADASSRTDLPTQILLGQLPMLLHPEPSRALVIGYGSGVTAGSILRHPVERVDCVEISPEVVRAAAFFTEASGDPLRDPRFHLQVEDALAYLQLNDRTYDAIVSEPSNPWIAGIGSLYTKEFFDLCRQRLTNGGLMVQWFHLYEMDDDMFRLVLRTFRSAFPHVTLWSPLSTDIILIGSEQEVGRDDSRLRDALSRSEVRSDLRRIGITEPGTILTLQVLSTDGVDRYVDEGPLNTEDLPLLEYGAPRAFFVNIGVKGLAEVDERIHGAQTQTALQQRWEFRAFTDAELKNAADWHIHPIRGNQLLAYEFIWSLHQRYPRDPEILRRLSVIAEQVGNVEEGLSWRRRRVELTPRDPSALEQLAWKLFETGNRTANALVPQRTEESEELLRRAIALVRDSVDLYRVRLADIMYSGRRYRQAADQYARAIQLRETHRPDPYIANDILFTRLALCLYQIGEKPRAAGYALRATQLNPDNKEARDLVYRIWTEGSSPQISR